MRQLPVRFLSILAALAIASPLYGQIPTARSADYMFATAVPDARALWVNPAGLGGRPVASLLAEVTGTKVVGDGWSVAQYSFALRSRNAAFGYRRDRFQNQPSLGAWRLGGGFGLTRLTLGTSLEFHSGGRSWDVGLQYLPTSRLTFAVVLQDIGRPVVRDSTALRLKSLVSLGWNPTPRTLIAAEAVAVERRPAPGYDVRYRAGGQVLIPGRSPFTVMTAFDLASGGTAFRLELWSVGLAFGGANQLVGVATVREPDGLSRRLETFSLAGLARAVSAR